MSKLALTFLLALILAGCAGVSNSSSTHSFSSQNTFTHDYSDGVGETTTFRMSGPGTISLDVLFEPSPRPVTASDVVVCPMEETDAKADLIAPDGTVARTHEATNHGVMGNGECGGGQGSLDADAGTWMIRFSGTANLRVRVEVRTASG